VSGVAWEVPEGESYQQWPPVEAGAVPRTARRRLLSLTAAAIGASIGLTVLCGGAVVLSMRAADGDLGRKPGLAAPTLPPPTVSPFSGQYNVPGDLCHDADFTYLRPLFTEHSGIEAVNGPDTGGVAVRECIGIIGNDAVSGRFRLVATVYPDAVAAGAAYFTVVKSSPGTAVASLGQQGWGYQDPERGRTVIAVDHNLVLAMSWRDDARPAVDPEDLDRTLVEVCRSSMRLLRFN
jgi:hypothetical protein